MDSGLKDVWSRQFFGTSSDQGAAYTGLSLLPPAPQSTKWLDRKLAAMKETIAALRRSFALWSWTVPDHFLS